MFVDLDYDFRSVFLPCVPAGNRAYVEWEANFQAVTNDYPSDHAITPTLRPLLIGSWLYVANQSLS